jgi:predicted HTH transcriptional regulator
VPDIDDTQLKISNRIRDNIQPPTLGLYDVVIENYQGKDVIKIIISSGNEKPYYLRSKGMSESGCFMRTGSGVQPMPSDMITELFSKRTRNSLSKIESPRDDLTFEQLKIYYEERKLKLNDRFKQSLELLTKDKQPNYVAYLLADENATSIKVAKYSGTDKVDLIENEEYGYCSLIKATKSVLNKFEIENITKTKITSRERVEKKLVDSVALREAIINAIVHNDYSSEVPPLFEIFSDRIVITSYGGLIDGLSEEEFFGCCSKPRNRELMRVFKDVGLVEQ